MIGKCRKTREPQFWFVQWTGDNLKEIEDLLRDEAPYVELNKETKELKIVDDFDTTWVNLRNYILIDEEYGEVFAIEESVFKEFYEEIREK